MALRARYVIGSCEKRAPGKQFLYHVIQSGTKFVQMEQESETRGAYHL